MLNEKVRLSKNTFRLFRMGPREEFLKSSNREGIFLACVFSLLRKHFSTSVSVITAFFSITLVLVGGQYSSVRLIETAICERLSTQSAQCTSCLSVSTMY